MAKFLKLTNEYNKDVYINFEIVTNFIVEANDDFTQMMTMVTSASDYIFVKETPEEIMEMLEG